MKTILSDSIIRIYFKFPLDDPLKLYFSLRWYLDSPELLIKKITLVHSLGLDYAKYNDFGFIQKTTFIGFESILYSYLIRATRISDTKISFSEEELNLVFELSYLGKCPSQPPAFDRKLFLDYLHREIDDKYGRN